MPFQFTEMAKTRKHSRTSSTGALSFAVRSLVCRQRAEYCVCNVIESRIRVRSLVIVRRFFLPEFYRNHAQFMLTFSTRCEDPRNAVNADCVFFSSFWRQTRLHNA